MCLVHLSTMTSTNGANGSAERNMNGKPIKMCQTDIDIVQLDLTLKNLKENAKKHSKFHGDGLIGVRLSNLRPCQPADSRARTNSRLKASLQISRILPTTSRRSCRARIYPPS
jgi:hypothetical protein